LVARADAIAAAEHREEVASSHALFAAGNDERMIVIFLGGEIDGITLSKNRRLWGFVGKNRPDPSSPLRTLRVFS
jgi:hypothetical protein